MNTSRVACPVSNPAAGCFAVDRRAGRWFVPYTQDPPAFDAARWRE